MSSLGSLPARDLEQLSAYADGELTPTEADRLRSRLEQEPSLRHALDELRHTAGLLRSLPPLPVPRSFALSAERAGARRQYPRLQLATALASLAFVVVVGMDVLTRSSMRMAPISPIIGQLAAPAAEQELLAAEAEVEQKEQPAAEEELQLAPMEAAGTPEASAARAAELAPTPTAEVGLSAAEAQTPVAEEGLLAAEAPQATTTQSPSASYADAVETAPAQATAEPAGTGLPSATAAALAQEVGEAESEAAAEEERAIGAQPAEAQPPADKSQDDQLDGLRAVPPEQILGAPELAVQLLEVGLGAAVLLLGLLTVRSRRRM